MSQYQHIFWSVTGITTGYTSYSNPDDTTTLVDDGDYGSDVTDAITTAVNNVFNADTSGRFFAARFVGGRSINLPPMISFMFNPDQGLSAGGDLTTLTQTITSELQNQSVLGDSVAAVVQNPTRFNDLTDEQANNITVSQNLQAHLAANAAIAKHFKGFVEEHEKYHEAHHITKQSDETSSVSSSTSSPDTSDGTVLPFTYFRDLPYKDSVQGFSITSDLYESFLSATSDDDLSELIHSLYVAFRQISTETNTSAIVTLMLSAGIVTIGTTMWDAYELLGDSSSTVADLVPKLITSAGGATVINPIAALLSGVLSIASLRAGSAKNVLLTVNGSTTPFFFNGDAIGHGERDVAAPVIPQFGTAKLAYPCATYGYGMYSTPVVNGPWIGFSLTTDNEWFSVGMNCSHTVFGNPNSVRLLEMGTDKDVAEDTRNVAQIAKDWTDCTDDGAHQTITIKNAAEESIVCVGKRSALWGNTNFGLCFLSDAGDDAA